jgi:hypothetical protein
MIPSTRPYLSLSKVDQGLFGREWTDSDIRKKGNPGFVYARP